MRIMMMHRTEPKWERGELPGPELIAGMGALMAEMQQAGVLLSGGGLRPSSMGVRLNVAGGKRTITPGPFTPGNELPAGFAILRTRSLEEAVAWSTRFAELIGDVEVDIRPVTEAWDLGMMPRPADLTTTRYMAVHKANAASESGAPPTTAMMERMGKLIEEMAAAGVLLAAEELTPSAQGLRLRFRGGKRSITDGPFAESKELIAGFVMLQVRKIEDALPGATRFAACTGDVELDLRPLAD